MARSRRSGSASVVKASDQGLCRISPGVVPPIRALPSSCVEVSRRSTEALGSRLAVVKAMTPELRKLVLTSLLSVALGAASTFVFVWRDMAVVRAELAHIREDVSLIQTFVSNDDPRAWMAAKARIKLHRERDEDKTAQAAEQTK